LGGETLEQWLLQAEAENPAVRAAISALEIANDEIRKQRAGHEPTVDLTMSYGKNNQGSGTYGGQVGYNSTTSAIGLQFNLPIYSGGGQSAKVREAEALRDKALQELESARRNARAQSKQAWYGWQASQSRLIAAKQAIGYSRLNLQAALSGVATGVKKELDVLRGQQELYGALRDLARARYELTLNNFRMKATVGQLTDENLTGLDKWFVTLDKPSALLSFQTQAN
jgi:outer membrane protein